MMPQSKVPAMKYPVWQMTDQSIQLSMPGRDGAAEGGVRLYEIEADSWEQANVKFCERLGREPYVPPRAGT
jgi:hypothetical protein